MRVSIIGTGSMARGIAVRALAGGHQVVLVGTHAAKARDLADELSGEGPVTADEQVGGDMVVLAVPFTVAPNAVRQHAAELDGTVLVDVTNPVDLGTFEPLDVRPFRSGAEVIAEEVPEGASLVKAFNTTLAGTLIAGQVAGRPLDVFIAGDDEAARSAVARLASDGGLRPVEAGPLA